MNLGRNLLKKSFVNPASGIWHLKYHVPNHYHMNPLVNPIPTTDPSIIELVNFYNETLGFCPNSVRTMQLRPHLAEAFINLNKAVMENHGKSRVH